MCDINNFCACDFRACALNLTTIEGEMLIILRSIVCTLGRKFFVFSILTVFFNAIYISCS